jgi:folate-dependent phosphoribosylglycinamide formyltransferase PurN
MTVIEIVTIDNETYYTLLSDIDNNIFYILNKDTLKKLILNGYLSIVDVIDYINNAKKINDLNIGSKISSLPATINNLECHFENIMTITQISINNINKNIIYTIESDIDENIKFTITNDFLKILILNGYLTIIDDYIINSHKINELVIGSKISTMPANIKDLNIHYENMTIITEINIFDNIIYYTLETESQNKIIYTLNKEDLTNLILKGCLTIIS